MANRSNSSDEEFETPRINVKDTLKIIPPPSMLRSRERKRIVEKRIRVRYSKELSDKEAKLSSKLASELNLDENDYIEIIVAGKKRLSFKPKIDESLDSNEVFVNQELLKINGIADNSIATIKKVPKNE